MRAGGRADGRRGGRAGDDARTGVSTSGASMGRTCGRSCACVDVHGRVFRVVPPHDVSAPPRRTHRAMHRQVRYRAVGRLKPGGPAIKRSRSMRPIEAEPPRASTFFRACQKTFFRGRYPANKVFHFARKASGKGSEKVDQKALLKGFSQGRVLSAPSTLKAPARPETPIRKAAAGVHAGAEEAALPRRPRSTLLRATRRTNSRRRSARTPTAR